jgi:hypothetical protein
MTKPPDVRAFFINQGFFIWCDLNHSSLSFWFLFMILGGFVFAEILAFILVYWIARVLGKNAHSFSKKTYAMHHRLMLLLAFQVGYKV